MPGVQWPLWFEGFVRTWGMILLLIPATVLIPKEIKIADSLRGHILYVIMTEKCVGRIRRASMAI
ncbi:hypothetical protein HNR39_001579 [Glaciimonas immobilis]|uniref:Uncharacterized protein n=1 Tax=Glaciimonas immobilis TaxID=728004 RepID=A0A840RN47_9BURK|nr:hypothetical protein [Glaciimonas immobilis]